VKGQDLPMITYDPSNAECLVFTFKEGLLSPIAHDLRLRVTRFSIEVDDAKGAVAATFDTSSLRVETPMKDGKENPSALSDADRDKIAGQIRDDVLHSAKFPEARFQSRVVTRQADGGYVLEGDLTLHGATRAITAQTTPSGGKQQLELTLHQPDFGITPYKAMMGTLKIQPDVKVRIVA
jgi:polyisoprenoid-binding protein YceI